MEEPYAASVRFESVVGNVAGALLDLTSLAQDAVLRMQVYHALSYKEAQIRRLMPPRPTIPKGPQPRGPTIGPARDSGVLAVVWVNRSQYPDPAGGYLKVFKRLDVIGAYSSQYWAIDCFQKTPRIDSVETGYVSEPMYLWLTP